MDRMVTIRVLRWSAFRPMLAAIVSASLCSFLAAGEPQAGTPRAAASDAWRVEVDGTPVFAEQFRGASFAFVALQPERVGVRPANVTLHWKEPVRTFNISPHSAGIKAVANGTSLTIAVDRPRHLVITVNDGEKLLLFVERADQNAPKPRDRSVINVKDLGIDDTGKRLETARLQQGIDRASASRGVLYFPEGTYLTGTLSLKSNVTVYLAEGARLLGSHNPGDYPADPGSNEADTQYSDEVVRRMGRYDAAYRRLLLVEDASNVRIAGPGIIEGRGKILRPQKNIMFIMLRRASDVVIEDVTLLDSPMYNIHAVGSDRLTFRNLKIVSDQSVHNTDGIDPDSSRDVLIERCFFLCADDCIAIKTSGQSGIKGDAERITIRDCVFISRTSGIKLGSETSAGWQRSITCEDIDLLEADRAITISCMDGHGFENVRFSNTRIERLIPVGMKFETPFLIRVRQRGDGVAGRIRNFAITNLHVEQPFTKPSIISGISPTGDVRGIRFENYTVGNRRMRNPEEAKITVGPHASDITFADNNAAK
jgi:hypothetical protein